MKVFVVLGSFNMFLGVALGAFGAHGLKTRLAPEMLKTWETAVFYHLIHAVGLLAIGVLVHLQPQVDMIRSSGWSLLVGMLLFSGSLYVMVLSGVKALGMITPMGGIAFLVGWLFLFLSLLKV